MAEKGKEPKILITSFTGTEFNSELGVQYLSVSVSRRFNTPSQPLEDGTPIIDHKIRLPIEVNVSCLVRHEKIKDVMSKLNILCNQELASNKTVRITDKIGNNYANLVLVDYSHTENAGDKFDNYYFDLKFREVMFS